MQQKESRKHTVCAHDEQLAGNAAPTVHSSWPHTEPPPDPPAPPVPPVPPAPPKPPVPPPPPVPPAPPHSPHNDSASFTQYTFQ
ncbi:MAG: hypothetical protein CVU63_07855 [Deltaproteobacteria bacterium HGW-Deltaproteobacteria-20]|nr:MAG: hypothetical protein CVU63_07855 [Deltaproteobacteria bacterium HGW-Deltaproteobacteria-20]